MKYASAFVLLLASSGALVVACTTTTTTSAPASAGAPSSSGDDDASASAPTPDESADASAQVSVSADSGGSATLVLMADGTSPDESCAAFCTSRGSSCATTCTLPSGKAGAGYITDVVDPDTLETKTKEYASCSDKVVSAAGSVGTQAYCCCTGGGPKTVTRDLSGKSTCDEQCKAAGLTCDSGGWVTFTRADETTCGRAVTCSEDVSPTAICSSHASVSASLACACR